MAANKKKILAVLSRVPWPLEKGDKLRAYYLLRELSKQHEVYLFCLSDKPIHPETETRLKEWCKEIYVHRLKWPGLLWRLLWTCFRRPRPFQVSYFHSARAQKAFDRFLEQHIPDIIFCQLVRTAEYVRKYTMFSKTMDYMDALSAGMERTAAKSPWYTKPVFEREASQLSSYEEGIYPLFDRHLVISEQDREALIHGQAREFAVVENGVDEKFLQDPGAVKTTDVLFTGNMSYRPNVESAQFLVKEIMPLVWKEFPAATLTLAGANPSARVRALQGDKVKVTGWVADIRDCYAASKVFCAPMLINSGLQNKLLEAMAMGVPSVTTSLANNALGATHQQNIMVADTAADIAKNIIDLLKDAPLRKRIGQQGHLFIKDNYSWKKAGNKLENLLFQPVGPQPSGPAIS